MKPTVPEILPLVRQIYARSPLGCCLHIVLDDGNIQGSHVRFCLGQAIERGHLDCERVASALLLMSRTQRTKIYNSRKDQ